MKLAKKILVAAIAVAALGLVGCQTNIAPEGFIKGTTYGAKVDHTNEGADTIRCLHRTNAKHSGGIWTIEQNVTKNTTGAAKNGGDGLMGIIYDLNKNENGTYNFLVVGTGANNKKDVTYVSYFVNISEDALNSQNFGCSQKKSSVAAAKAAKNTATPYEVELYNPELTTFGTYCTTAESSDFYSEDPDDATKKVFKVKIAVEPSMTSGEYDGKINIKFYKADASIELDKAGQVTGTDASNFKAKKTVQLFDKTTELTAANTDSDEVSGYSSVKPSKFPQNYIGYYGNIYAGQTLKGKWTLGNGSTNQFNAAEEE